MLTVKYKLILNLNGVTIQCTYLLKNNFKMMPIFKYNQSKIN